MNRIILLAGAATLVIMGLTIAHDLSPMCAVGLGLMWMGLSIDKE